MNKACKEILWNQFGASLDMLENAIVACPDELWKTETRFWYIAYHVLFRTDYYLTAQPDRFSPIPPFRPAANDISEFIPVNAYTKKELLEYLQGCRNKCRLLISDLTDEIADHRWEMIEKIIRSLKLLFTICGMCSTIQPS